VCLADICVFRIWFFSIPRIAKWGLFIHLLKSLIYYISIIYI
jgi:hypothetical protein